MKSTVENTRAITVNTIVMIVSLVISLRGQVTLPENQNIEVNNLIVNINTIEVER